MADDPGVDRPAGRERSGPPTWVIVVSTLAAAALLAAGVAAWLTWRPEGDEDAAPAKKGRSKATAEAAAETTDEPNPKRSRATVDAAEPAAQDKPKRSRATKKDE